MDALNSQSDKTRSLSLSSSMKRFLIKNEDVDKLPAMEITQLRQCFILHISQTRWGKIGFLRELSNNVVPNNIKVVRAIY